MIIKMDITHVIAVFVEKLLPRFSDRKKILAMSFRISATKSDNSQKEVVRKVHLLFHRPDNYTKVLWNVGNREHFRDFQDISVWEVKCCHDSEWRTSGLGTPLFKLGFEMVKELDSMVRPIDCQVVARFHLMDLPEIIKIKDYKYNPDPGTFVINWR